jgi:hypothetical protein
MLFRKRNGRTLPWLVVLLGAAACSNASPSSAPEPTAGTFGQKSLGALRLAEQQAAQVRAVAENLSLDDRLHLLTRFTTPTGSVIEFFEPYPGLIQMWEVGDVGTDPFQTPYGKKPVEIFQAARPDLEVPASLILAQARTGDGTFRESPKPVGGVRIDSAVVSSNAWCGSAWFIENVPYAAWGCEPSLYGLSGGTCWLNTFAGVYSESVNNYRTDAAAYCNPTSSYGRATIYRSDFAENIYGLPAVDVAIAPGSWVAWADTSTGSTTVCHTLGFLDCYPVPNTHSASYTFDTPNGAQVSVAAIPASQPSPSGSPPGSVSCQECYYDCGVGCQDVGLYCTNQNVAVSGKGNPGCGYCVCD